MYILGISCFYHDSAAALIRDGEIISAAQEERFTRKKHDFNFPRNAADWCFKSSGISAKDVDLVVFYDKPFIKFERILETYLSYAPSGIKQFIQAIPLWLKQKLWIPDLIRQELGYNGKVLFTEHHESHAASAFYPSPYQDAAFLTIDGVGEWDTASFGVGKDNDIEILYTLRFPHSLGLLYSAFTYYAGFRVNSGEYKLMGLAPYGEPKYADLILKELIDLKEDGSFKMNMRYFGYANGLRMTNWKFEKLFGGLPRKPESRITQKDMDAAASIQEITEEIMLRMARHVHKITGKDKLCLAGGVALNCVGNGKILREGPFKEVWVQPASGDAGAALGAALLGWYKYLGNKRHTDGVNDLQKASLIGPEFKDDQIEVFLKKENAAYKIISYIDLPKTVADLIAKGNVIGWFEGRMEFGPRALGARSIIGDARSPEMQSKMNLKIKYRESFRPFAPSVLKEEVANWFDMVKESPYMLVVAPVREDKKVGSDNLGNSLSGFDKLKVKRSQIPAVTHVDYSARIQTVKREDNPLYYDMINEFFKSTGCPVIINTSFNVRGEPLVCSPEDAFKCFRRTEMDYLVMGSFLLDKKEQKAIERDTEWKKEFELD
ncbi:MAG: carbamoyltransferase [Candidatus Omnitrophota bacterium]|nr:carbamoyltransferase [Candidatus Omnitrophota bacterium]MBU1929447.1 carbamoyltransferase [Candidatus Omnitrophota bacterium]MBU2034829.1 carbamoyltransferase [Candidatus Omnitrophota bacterium]